MTKHHETKPTGAGKSSFGLIDSAKFFHELKLKKGITFLDVACGWGRYALAVSEIIGRNGLVYAVDLWEEGVSSLKKEAALKDIQNITSFVSDASQSIPVENQSVDVCLMATVLHDFVGDQVDRGVMQEIVRVMKPEAMLAIVEFKKIDGPPGPPKPIRLSPQEVDKIVSAYGFKQERFTEVGTHNYLQIFIKKE
ncbi:MAG: class I SAM-dependent methyltransferase [Desulfobacterales bacterium]